MASSGNRPTDQDLQRLDEKLKALSSPNRLRLVSELHEPRTVEDVKLTPAEPDEGEDPDRTLTSQGVRHHLSKLEDADLVHSRSSPNDGGRDRREYAVNEPSVYGLLEELRQLLAPGTAADSRSYETEMVTGADTGGRDWPDGPKLVLLQGSEEEQVFALRRIDPDPSEGRGWVIGRSPQAQISLQYDPYLSAQNTEILHDDGEFRIVDLRVSTNGTRLNDEPLTPGQEARLEHGDIVKVGGSALVFHR